MFCLYIVLLLLIAITYGLVFLSWMLTMCALILFEVAPQKTHTNSLELLGLREAFLEHGRIPEHWIQRPKLAANYWNYHITIDSVTPSIMIITVGLRLLSSDGLVVIAAELSG